MPDAKNELGPAQVCTDLRVKALAFALTRLSSCLLCLNLWETADKIFKYMALLCSQNVRALGWTPPSHPPAWSPPTTQRAAGIERIPISTFRS